VPDGTSENRSVSLALLHLKFIRTC